MEVNNMWNLVWAGGIILLISLLGIALWAGWLWLMGWIVKFLNDTDGNGDY
jgi:hypothetical protein